MKTLKPFKLEISGDFCDVPHPDRKMLLFVDGEEKGNELTTIDVLVICHEICINIRNRLQKIMPKSEQKEQGKKFDKYFFGKVTDKDKLRKVKIIITGIYYEEFTPERYLKYTIDNLTEGQANLILFDTVCVARNQLLETMTRDEISDIAEKHKIYNFGMVKNESPFATRS